MVWISEDFPCLDIAMVLLSSGRMCSLFTTLRLNLILLKINITRYPHDVSFIIIFSK